MAGLEIGETYYVTVDGITLFSETKLGIQGVGEDVDIFTQLRGWAGQSIAPRKIVITVDMAVLSEGLELDIFKRWNESAKITYEVVGALSGKRLAGDCFVRAPKIDAGTGQMSSSTFELHASGGSFV